jgi:hypothetical protein
MVAIAIGLVWAGYTGAFYGYCLLRGYNVTPKQLLSRSWPPASVKSGPEGGSGFGPGGSAGGGAGGGGGGSW